MTTKYKQLADVRWIAAGDDIEGSQFTPAGPDGRSNEPVADLLGNTEYLRIRTSVLSPLLEPEVVNSSFTAVKDIAYLLTVSPNIKVTFPDSPEKGDSFRVKMVDGDPTASVLLDGNGNKISNTSTKEINANYFNMLFVFDGSQWAIASGGGATGEGSLSIRDVVTVDTVVGDSDINGIIPVQTSGTSTITMTLPATPATGTTIGFVDYDGNWASGPLRVTSAGTIAGGSDDILVQRADACIVMQYVDAIQGWKIVYGTPAHGDVDWSTVSKSSTLIPGTGYWVDTSSLDTEPTITLPASPSKGMKVGFGDYTGNFGTRGCYIALNGSKFMGQSEDLLLETSNLVVVAEYVDSTIGWKIISGVGLGGGVDTTQVDTQIRDRTGIYRVGNISAHVGESLSEADKLNSYQYPDNSGEWYGVKDGETFPVTIPADPSGDNGWALITAVTPTSLGALTNYHSASVDDMILGKTIGWNVGEAFILHELGQRWVTSFFNSKTKQYWEIVASGVDDIERGTISVGSGLFAELQVDDMVYLEWFGATDKKDGYPTASSSSDLQKMFNYCYRNKIKKATTNGNYFRFDEQVIVPFFDNERSTIFDFDWNGMLATGMNNSPAGTQMFISGYLDDADTPVANTGTQETKAAYNFRMHNGYVEDALRFVEMTNMLGTSKIYHFFCNNVAQAVKSHRCFYGSFWDIVAWGGSIDPETVALDIARFEVNDNNNIMPISECASNGHAVCLDIKGASEALEISDFGFEGWSTNGVRLSGTAYGVKFSNPYFETGSAIGGAVKVVSGTAPNVTFDNGWYLGDFAVIDPGTKPIAGLWWSPNNRLETDTRLFDAGTQYCFGKIEYVSETRYTNVSNNRLTLPSKIGDAPKSIIIDAPQVMYSDTTGPSTPLAISEVTPDLNIMKCMGRMARGFGGSFVPFCNVVVNSGSVIYNTSITYEDSQVVLVNLKVNHSTGVWHWRGLIVGSEAVKLGSYTQNDPTITTDANGFMVITSPALNSPEVYGGTIRLI
ncbi:hypothetical protein VP150E351_P0049 [Vibrio phage 150E35-1]|nr:hypothetical protein VP150E351_P0049 [Vibrio phage 150E35-1]